MARCARNTPTNVGRSLKPLDENETDKKHPTNVGRRRYLRGCRPGWRKHPHERGEEDGPQRPPLPRRETPPRTWGGELPRICIMCSFGNTPTNVGRSWTRARRTCTERKHPHERGEEHHFHHRGLNPWETPPRTWGGVHALANGLFHARNTPTNVGRRSASTGRNTRTKKHPHERGEE